MSQTPLPAGNRPSRPEFIALMAMLVATIAFSLDAMLPAIPFIAEALSPGDPDKVHLVVPTFVLGMGLGTLIVGPFADAFGRKPVLLVFVLIYAGGSALSLVANSLEMLLFSRVLQGVGAAGPRVVAMTVIRDRFAGRDMAQLMSFIMMVFALVPALAPTLGAAIVAVFGWRGIFAAFIAFAAIGSLWFYIRQPETLPPEYRRPLDFKRIREGAKETLSQPVTRQTIMVQVLVYAMLYSNLATVQPVMDQIYGRAEEFPYWFAVIAVCGSMMGLLNAKLVGRLGMRTVVLRSLVIQSLFSVAFLVFAGLGISTGLIGFLGYFVWTLSVFMLIAMTMGNLNAMAMEPLGHLAGTATSIVTAASTIFAAALVVPVSWAFDPSSPVVMVLVLLVYSSLAVLLMRYIPRDEVVTV